MYVKPIDTRPDATLWVNVADGKAVLPDGRPYRMGLTGDRLTLAKLLEFVLWCSATRVMFVGEPLPRSFFMTDIPGWSHGIHYLTDASSSVYRFFSPTLKVEMRRTAEWFGEGDYDAFDAASAWSKLDKVLYASGRYGASLKRGPAATGADLWLRTHQGNIPEPLDDDVQDLIRSWSPQHRIQIFPPASQKIPGFHVIDGRFMYAALTRELGQGPIAWLRGKDAQNLFQRNPFARARCLVRFKAPEGYTSKICPLPVKAKGSEKDWDWTATEGETWADSAEILVAQRMGWRLEFIEGIKFTTARPLDTWTARILRARDLLASPKESLGEREIVLNMVSGALRTILLYGIGQFHSCGRQEQTISDSPMTRPAGEGWMEPVMIEDGKALWRREARIISDRQRALRHPEFSAQVWGRAHAHILSGPTGKVTLSDGSQEPGKAGLLHTPEQEIIAVYGDAIMTTKVPDWARLDDGKPGRLRLKGSFTGEVEWPKTARQRDALVRKAES